MPHLYILSNSRTLGFLIERDKFAYQFIPDGCEMHTVISSGLDEFPVIVHGFREISVSIT
jgi:hypothetical protein